MSRLKDLRRARGLTQVQMQLLTGSIKAIIPK